MKMPEDCENISEIRYEIDQIDQQIIVLLGERFAYVKAASQFKTSEVSVKAEDRFNSMLEQRRIWAAEKGLNPDVVEKMYRDLVNYFINEELKSWQENHNS
ncbi:isochorismate-pyruvate lyase [Brunnivagina elsteri CCALA 953]|uniref:Isochorismate-pyruvate lyase n=2 Tax=Brunnivagina TaxID=3344733 RepID=A0A2A2TLX3_9CYAN|nr:isochorismate-pyruvate lyase [Calothrix elsteri CCALA 953]